MAFLGISEAADAILKRALSPVELTKACLARIDALNSTLDAFITVLHESALEQAHTVEREISKGVWRGPLHGIPIALKDLIDTAGVRTTAGSAVFADRIPAEDAEVVTRLKNAGAILLGKTNLHEFAYGGSSVISHFGPVRNPHDLSRIAGGSSSGSAVAVAAGMCLGAIGTDTAGSIREPASFCGVVGLKPTYGLVSARGVIPLAWSYDHVGPITRSVKDAAILLQTIAGYDEADFASQQLPIADYVAATHAVPTAMRVGVAREMFFDFLDLQVASAMDRVLGVMKSLGWHFREITVPLEPDRILANAESYSYHASFIANSPDKYQASTLARLRSGEHVTAAECLRAQHRLITLRRTAMNLFEEVDVIITPTVPILPPTIEELQADIANLRQREILMLRNTRPFNVLGLPTLSLPCGRAPNGLPVGLQISAATGQESTLLSFAGILERRMKHDSVM